jgi:hypothetical protein
MAWPPPPIRAIPEEPARVARAALPQGRPYLTRRDQLGTRYDAGDGPALCPAAGPPGRPPGRLALGTLMPCRAKLSDRPAAEAGRARSDGQSLLGRALTDPGCDFSGLSACRDRLLAGSAAALRLEPLGERGRTRGWLPARGAPRLDSPQGRAAMRGRPRLERGAATRRAALNAVAAGAPDWLPALTPLAGDDRERWRIADPRLPQDTAAREAYAQMVGEEGGQGLEATETPEAPQAARA